VTEAFPAATLFICPSMSCTHKPCGSPPLGCGESLASVLDSRAAQMPDRLAYRFLIDGDANVQTLTYGELAARARRLAAGLVEKGAAGKPVVVAHPTGLEFLEGLFACWYAGAIAVPCYPPQGRRHRERLAAVVKDSRAKHVLGEAAHDQAFARLGINRVAGGVDGPDLGTPAAGTGPCLLQYTSGSTASPKGVEVSHQNLLHQLAGTRERFAPLELRSLLSWLPPYHDMGLVLKILHAVGSGIPLTFFSPEAFVQRPMRWLRAIDRYRADFSAAPNFAFELCLRAVRPEDFATLDLSCWKVAPCGAERVRPDTLARFAVAFAPCGFRHDTIRPGYGLAESTLTVTVCPPGISLRESRGRVSCGPPLDGLELRIVDPETQSPMAEGVSGEIQVHGPSVAGGYWHRPDESAETFRTDGWLRTGDLGFLEGGELFVEGRLKDLLIVDGTNHAPEDLEMAAAASDPVLIAAVSAAFALGEAGPERVALVQEVPRLSEEQHAPLCRTIREAIGESSGVALDRVVLVRQGTLPRTTSGKIRRAACRMALLEEALHVLHDDAAPAEETLDESGQKAFGKLSFAVVEATGRPAPQPGDDPVAYGLSSLDVTRIVAQLRAECGVNLSIGEVFASRSFAALANTLGSKAPGMVPDAIPIRPGNEPAVPSHSQERMWFLHQLEPDSAAYHVFGALELDGTLDGDALERAWRAILAKHEILRSRHGNRNGQPEISITAIPHPALFTEDSDECSIEGRLREFARIPFDLASDPPVRMLRLRHGETRNVLALCAHHIVADGWSVRVLLGELSTRYREERGVAQPLPAPVSPSYLDYAAWHRRWIEAGRADQAVDYWKQRLTGHDGTLSLPIDFPRPVRSSSEGGAVGRILPEDLLGKVKSLAVEHRTTPFTVFLAAFLIVLRQHGGGDDAVIAIPVANRNHAASGPLIGTLVNTLPFRLKVDGSESFAALIDRVRDASFEMQEAQDAPFERIIEAVQPERALDRSPLAQVMFDHQEIPLATRWAGGLDCRPRLAHRGAAQFDLSVLLFAFPDYHELYLEYRTDLFREDTVAAMLERYFSTLEQTASLPTSTVESFHGLTGDDRQWLDEHSHGPVRPDFLGRIPLAGIETMARRVPAKTAVVCGGDELSYAALLDRAEKLAAAFSSRGIGRDSRVAILLERDAWLPVVLLAVWKTGACYVPLDAANPPERLGWILEDQQPLAVLATPALLDRLPGGVEAIHFDPAMAAEVHEPFTAVELAATDPAYILYTSGSTGRPKGVVVSHGALGNFLFSMLEQPGLHESDRMAAITTVSFDISALELYLPLLAGATIDLIPGAISRDGMALRHRLETWPPTMLQATPATWRMLIDAGWQGAPNLKILCGGEALDLPLARQLHTLGTEVWNLYGPTETTVWSTVWQVPANAGRIVVGSPIANTDIRIVSPSGAPLPPGVTGELLIGGAGLADGYWQRPDLTEERFIYDHSSRWYRTGDLARWLPDGTLECLGRSDGQVKVRGFRVELGEVEAAMLSHPGIAEAAAIVTGEAGAGRLVGYVRPAGASLDLAALTRHLTERLPDYMVPAPLVEIASMPLTSSGKIDRRALAQIQPPVASSAPALPRDPVEAEVAAVWEDLLGTRPIRADDDFFALGGHSLLATRMTAELSRRLGFPVALDALFQRSTVATFASRIRETSEVDLSAPRAILLHQGTSDEPPVFWIHTLIDGGMGLFPYREAAGMLGSTVTSYGIAEGSSPFASIEEMAGRYVSIIRAVQPHGPYRLTGFCFGGNLAAEIAWQLAEAGETISSLVLLETRPVDARATPLAWLRPVGWMHALARLPGQVPRMARFDLAMARKRFGMKRRAILEALGGILRPQGEKIPNIHAVLDLTLLDVVSRERAIQHWNALHRHAPRLPEIRQLLVVRAAEDGWLPRPESLGWDKHAKGPIETDVVPGRHEDFLRGGSAREVAAVLRRVYEKAG